MTEHELKKANSISEEIRNIERFIATARKCWGRVFLLPTRETRKRMNLTADYGALRNSFQCSPEVVDAIIGVLEGRIDELRGRLARVGVAEREGS